MSFAYNVPDTNAQNGNHDLTLRVVHLHDVLLHEHTERQRVDRLVKRIQADQLLKNPPIVAPDEGRYVLLDGATRVTALTQLGYRDVIVQVVDYAMPGLTLDTWNHLLIGLPGDKFLKSLRGLTGLKIVPTSLADAGDTLNRRASVGTIVLADGQVLSLRLTSSNSLAQQVEVLNQVVAAYEGRSALQRITNSDATRLSLGALPWSALIVFPRYGPEDIRALARNGHKLPTGITRHIIPGRALRINIPLELLQRTASLEQKNAALAQWLQTKMREQRVRYYHEPVFLFDE